MISGFNTGENRTMMEDKRSKISGVEKLIERALKMEVEMKDFNTTQSHHEQ